MTNLLPLFARGELFEKYYIDTVERKIYGPRGQLKIDKRGAVNIKSPSTRRLVYINMKSAIESSLQYHKEAKVQEQPKEEKVVIDTAVVKTTPMQVETLSERYIACNNLDAYDPFWCSDPKFISEAMMFLDKASERDLGFINDVVHSIEGLEDVYNVETETLQIQVVCKYFISPKYDIMGARIKLVYETWTFDEICMDLFGRVTENYYAPVLRDYWLSAIRATYVDVLKYRNGYMGLTEFPAVQLNHNTVQEVISMYKTLIALFGHRDLKFF